MDLKLKRRIARRRASRIAREVADRRLTYLSWRSLRNLERAVKLAGRVPGDFIEAGVALGGSAVVIGQRMPAGRTLHLYDTFGMIPPTTERDDEHSKERYEVIASGRSGGIRGDEYYGYMDDLYTRVRGTLDSFGLNGQVEMHKGLFQDTLDPEGPVAFAHLDCDWYESVKTCLERIHPVLSSGGLMISDDYHNYGGCTEAVDEFLASHPDVVKVDMGGGPPENSTNLVLRKR